MTSNLRLATTFLRLGLSVIAGVLLTVAGSSATAASGTVDIRSRPIHLRRALLNPMSAGITGLSSTYHNGATLRCSDCHMMHQSKQHQLDDDLTPDPFGGYPQNPIGGPALLKTADPIDLCLTCHDNQAGIPDVMGMDVNGLTERSAGFFDAVGVRNPRGHSLDRNLASDWELCYRCHFVGEFATASVTCIDCHNPHGNGRARNLQWASWPGGEPQFGLLEADSAAGLQRYESGRIAYGTDNTDNLREVSNMCLDCHHVFSGESYIDPDGNGWHNRHPSYESERNSPNNIAQGGAPRFTTAAAHWEAGTGAGFGVTPRLRFVTSGATIYADAMHVDATKNGVFCLSCHQAHGNSHSFALRWDPAAGIAGNGCDQCHNKTNQ
ncbi:MAG: hypothetical protein AB1792_07220 [Candidatus Zixiibacteriota bacterium]